MALPEVIDTLDMFDAIAGLPEQVEQAAAAAAQSAGPLPAHDDIENVVVLGMGGSGIAGDVVREVAGPFMPVPVVVHKGYGMPNFIGDSTLVFAVSFSGNTEETLEAVGEASAAGCPHRGREQRWRARRDGRGVGRPHVPIADGIPMPRAGIGAVAIPPLVLLERVGLFPGASSWIEAAIAQLAPSARRAGRRRQPGRGPGPPHRPRAADRLRRRRAGWRGRAAVEEPVQRERQGRRRSGTSSPSSATTRCAAGASTVT